MSSEPITRARTRGAVLRYRGPLVTAPKRAEKQGRGRLAHRIFTK